MIGAEVVAVCRRELDVEHAYGDWCEMLNTETLDGVVVSTSNNNHAKPTLAALE